MTAPDIPEGFEPLSRSSPFIDMVGPLYHCRSEGGLLVGFRAEEKHCNRSGFVHGGLLCTVADIALGYNAAGFGGAETPMVTASMTIDFAGSASAGDWVVYRADVQKVGKKVAFANCYAHVGDKRIIRASGLFSVLNG
jgi:uncharacterized protein (TIGR00369 family)